MGSPYWPYSACEFYSDGVHYTDVLRLLRVFRAPDESVSEELVLPMCTPRTLDYTVPVPTRDVHEVR